MLIYLSRTDDVLVAGTLVSMIIGDRKMPAAVAQFGPQRAYLSGSSIVPVVPFAADGPLEDAAELRGAIALIARGGVTFVEKAQRACAAGAVGVVFVNHDDSPYVPLGTDGAEAITIPSVCVGKRDGDAILDMLETNGSELTIMLVHTDTKEEPRRTDWFGKNGGVLTVEQVSCSGLIKTDSIPKPLLGVSVQSDTTDQRSRLKRSLSPSPLRPGNKGNERGASKQAAVAQKARCALATTMPSFTDKFRFPIAAQPDSDDDGLRLVVELLDESSESEPPALIGMVEISLSDTLGFSTTSGQSVTLTKELSDPIGAVDEVHVRARLREMAEYAAESSPRRAHAASLFGSVTLHLQFTPIVRSSPVSSPAALTAVKVEGGGSARKVARIFSRKDPKSPVAAESAVSINSVAEEGLLPSDTKPVPEDEARLEARLDPRKLARAPETVSSPRVDDAPTSLPPTPPRGVEAQPAPGVVNLFAELFARVDRNDNGTITRAELIEAIYADDAVRSTVGLPQRLSDAQRQELEAVFIEMDSDTSDGIDLTEFCVFMYTQFPDGNMAARFAPAPALFPVEAPAPVPTIGVGVDSPPPPVPKVGVGVGSPSPRTEPREQAVAMHSLRAASPQPPSAATRTFPAQHQQLARAEAPPAQLQQLAKVPKLAFEIEDLATDYGSRENVSSSSDDDIDHGDRDLLSDSDDLTPVARTPVKTAPERVKTAPERVMTHAGKASPKRTKSTRVVASSKPADSAAGMASKQVVPQQAASAEERRLKLQRQEEKAAAKHLAEQEAHQRKNTSNLPQLLISGTFLRDCLCSQESGMRQRSTPVKCASSGWRTRRCNGRWSKPRWRSGSETRLRLTGSGKTRRLERRRRPRRRGRGSWRHWLRSCRRM